MLMSNAEPMNENEPVFTKTELAHLEFFKQIHETLENEEFSPKPAKSPAISKAEEILADALLEENIRIQAPKVLEIEREILKKLTTDISTNASWDNGKQKPTDAVSRLSTEVRDENCTIHVALTTSKSPGSSSRDRQLIIRYDQVFNDQGRDGRVSYFAQTDQNGNLLLRGYAQIEKEPTKTINFDSQGLRENNNIEPKVALQILQHISNEYLAAPVQTQAA